MASVDFKTFKNVINGKLSDTTDHWNHINPSTGEKLPSLPLSTEKDVDDAVKAARAAFPAWSRTSFDERKELLLKFGSLMTNDEYAKPLAQLLSDEMGKPFNMALDETMGCGKWLVGNTMVKLPEIPIVDDENVRSSCKRVPLGIVGAIVPWNFPLSMAIWKIGPALLTGNCCIVKPSEYSPYSALKMVEIAQQVFPPGVLQAYVGDRTSGPMLVEHPDVQGISFTGSIATGKKIMATAAKTMKRVALEMGGNDPCIVCEDVDIPLVAQQVALQAFLNSSQVCLASKRIYVHSKIYEQFRDAMVSATKSLPVGAASAQNVMLGPVANKAQFDKVKTFFDDSTKEKLTFASGGQWQGGDGEKGYFVEPTIVDSPPEDSKIVTEEPFGPIVPLLKWTDEADVIRRANNTDFGLGATVFSKDTDRAERIANEIEAGIIWVNGWGYLTPFTPFGGHKSSGIGAAHGEVGMAFYTNTKTITVFKKQQINLGPPQ